MGLYAIKTTFVRALRPIEDRLVRRGVTPDALTRTAVVVSVLAGLCVAAGGLTGVTAWWLGVPPLALMRLACNALDGSIARRTHRSSSLGAMRNEIGDRVGDAAMIGSLVAVAPAALALGALAASSSASAAGVLSQALTGVRDTAGPMAKPDRVAAIALAAAVAAAAGAREPFTYAAVAITVGAVATLVVRLARLRRSIAGAAPSQGADVIAFPLDEVVDPETLHGYAR